LTFPVQSFIFTSGGIVETIEIGHHALTTKEFTKLARGLAKPELCTQAKKRIADCAATVAHIASCDEPVYGINTGFGSLANVKIDRSRLDELQKNLINSHCAAIGEPLHPDVVRGAMILRANAISMGHSGTRLEVVELLLEMVNRNIIPKVPTWGSVGASGDLALLSTIAACLLPDSQITVYYKGSQVPACDAFKTEGLKPISLTSKEGLSLNNGCQVSNSLAALCLHDAKLAIEALDFAFSLSAQALLARSSPFQECVHNVRPHSGQMVTADIYRQLLTGSKLIDADKSKVQDAYSIRCAPQVVGAVRQAFGYCRNIIETEMNSATDNPLVFGKTVVSGGNFHGAPLAQACDFLAIALADLASISERRIYRLVSPSCSGLPAFLTDDPGLKSGFMIAQYTAANLVSACKTFSHPASVDSIPTCDNQEDHVSMAPVAAWKLRHVVDNLVNVAAIELLTACQAINMRLDQMKLDKSALSLESQVTFCKVRNVVPFTTDDVVLTPLIEKVASLILGGKLGE
jgi:histidine ammonia-lyase